MKTLIMQNVQTFSDHIQACESVQAVFPSEGDDGAMVVSTWQSFVKCPYILQLRHHESLASWA